MSKYSVGIDPGYRNLGFSFVDIASNKATMHLIDLAKWKDGLQKDIDERNLAYLLCDLLDDYHDALMETKYLAIEKQPGIGRRKILACASYIYGYIKGRYPNIELFLVSPVSYKAYFNCKVGNYRLRKDECIEVGVVDVADRERVSRAFTLQNNPGITKAVFHGDPIEAAMLGIYIINNLDKERAVRAATPSNPGYLRTTVIATVHPPVDLHKDRRIDSKAERKSQRAAARYLLKKEQGTLTKPARNPKPPSKIVKRLLEVAGIAPVPKKPRAGLRIKAKDD